MNCKKCGNEIKEGEMFCSKCGAKIKQEKNKKSNKKIIIISIAIVVLIAIAIGIILYFNQNVEQTSKNENTVAENNEIEQASSNIQANGTDKVSFTNMNSDDENLSEDEQAILKYFDNDYFEFSVEFAQRYPQIFKDAKVEAGPAQVIKVINSTDEEYEAVVSINAYGLGITSMEEDPDIKDFFVIRGKQLSSRIIAGDEVTIYGRYVNVENFEIDGKTYNLPVINVMNIIKPNWTNKENDSNYRFGLDTIKPVAEYIFGKNIKISEPVFGEDYDLTTNNPDEFFYMVTLDNQSNANFKVFDMSRSNGTISYNIKHNNISSGTNKELFVSADFQHFIVTTYDKNLKHIYIDYYDRNLQKQWGREFEYTSNNDMLESPMDYTDTQMAIVIDNDLHLIDLSSGEDIIEPVIVGNKIRVNMMNDGIILIGNDNKDTIMKVDYEGKIIFRTDADTQNLTTINYAYTQIVDGKMVICLQGTNENFVNQIGASYDDAYPTKYIVLNSDGTVEVSTEG